MPANQLSRPRKARTGFTLIELLVVIAIIALLAAILFPVFARARENARRSRCQSNLKQIGLGLIQYAQDFDETVPHSWYNVNTTSNNTDIYKWMDAIYPYVKSEQIFVCPSDTLSNTYTYYKNIPTGQGWANYGSYGYNSSYYDGGAVFTSPGIGMPGSNSVNMSAIAAPATTVWAADNNNYYEFAWSKSANPTIAAGTPRSLSTIMERHLDTTNVLYCDGHVKSQKLDSLIPTKSIADSNNGNTLTSIMTAFTIQDD